jgi:hypothetical protein
MTMREQLGALLQRDPARALSLLCGILLARRPGGVAMVAEEELAMAVMHSRKHRVVWDPAGELRLVELGAEDSAGVE